MPICNIRIYEVTFFFKEKLGFLVSKESVHCLYLISGKAYFLLGKGRPTSLTSPGVGKDCRPRRLTWNGCCRGFCGTKRWPIGTSPPCVWGCCWRAKKRRSGNSFKVTKDLQVKHFSSATYYWEVLEIVLLVCLSTDMSKSSSLESVIL